MSLKTGGLSWMSSVVIIRKRLTGKMSEDGAAPVPETNGRSGAIERAFECRRHSNVYEMPEERSALLNSRKRWYALRIFVLLAVACGKLPYHGPGEFVRGRSGVFADGARVDRAADGRVLAKYTNFRRRPAAGDGRRAASATSAVHTHALL